MIDKPHYLEHRKRLRERFDKAQSDGLYDYELLELLLTFAIPRKDVKAIAKKLLKEFDGLPGVLDADQKRLEKMPGMGKVSATLVKLVKELCTAYLAEGVRRREALTSPRAVLDFARAKLGGLPHETFMVVFLNVKNELIKYELVQEGTVDRAVIYPRRIIESALTNHAAAMILIHNHPSGHPEPSEEDKRLTRSLGDAAGLVDVKVVDHIIIGKGGYFSFAEQRLLKASR